MSEQPTVADLLLMPSIRSLPRHGVRSAVEQFIRSYNFDLFARLHEAPHTADPEFLRIVAECEADALCEAQDAASGLQRGIYRLLFQDAVVGFVRMRLRPDLRCPDLLMPRRCSAFHVDAGLAQLLASRISQSLVVVADSPPRMIDAPVHDFLVDDGDAGFRDAVQGISDATLRRLLNLNLSPWC